MISEFRKKKITFIFNFFDQDKNGFIEKSDFEESALYLQKQRGWKPDDAQFKVAHTALLKFWESLQKHADNDNDGKVTLEEWVSMWDEYAKNPSAPRKWQCVCSSCYCRHIFNIHDSSGDGAIDVDEFSTVLASFGIDKEDSIKSFAKLSKGKSTVSWEEFQELWKEFFISEDPEAPGNFIFGTGTFDA